MWIKIYLVINYTISICSYTIFCHTKQESNSIYCMINCEWESWAVRKLNSKNKHKFKDTYGKEYPVNLNIKNIKKFHTLSNLIHEKNKWESISSRWLQKKHKLVPRYVAIYRLGFTDIEFHVILLLKVFKKYHHWSVSACSGWKKEQKGSTSDSFFLWSSGSLSSVHRFNFIFTKVICE